MREHACAGTRAYEGPAPLQRGTTPAPGSSPRVLRACKRRKEGLGITSGCWSEKLGWGTSIGELTSDIVAMRRLSGGSPRLSSFVLHPGSLVMHRLFSVDLRSRYPIYLARSSRTTALVSLESRCTLSQFHNTPSNGCHSSHLLACQRFANFIYPCSYSFRARHPRRLWTTAIAKYQLTDQAPTRPAFLVLGF